MNRIITFFILIALSFCACTEVITLDLDTAQQRPVIDAILDATKGVCTVSLTKSGSFYQTSDYEYISDADIYLTKPDGQQVQLLSIGNGNYIAENIEVISGESYRLTLSNVEGKTYMAEAEAPYPSAIVDITKQIISNPSSDSLAEFITSIVVADNPVSKNYYRIKAYINGKFQANDFDFTDDVFFDGLTVEFPNSSIASEGDTVVLELLSMDKKMFQYLIELSENIDLNYNPKGNFDGDVLGRFGIYFSDSKTINL